MPKAAKTDSAKRRGGSSRRRQRQRRAFFDWRYVPVESRRSYRMACVLFWSILMYGAFHAYAISLGLVTDRSMLPTMPDGSYFLINRYVYHLHPPRRGDVVVVSVSPDPTEPPYVKRVIAVSGERLWIHGGRVYIDGRLLDEPYAVGWTFPEYGPMQLPLDRYFVMGDNREQSFDSRHFGTISHHSIQGRIRPGRLFAF